MGRIDQVNAKLAASLDAEGKPKKGYKRRVAACRAELDRLTTGPVEASKESDGLTSGPSGA